MNEPSNNLRIAMVVGVWALVLLVGLNTCAVDRLEQQIILTRQAVEGLGGVTSGGAVARRPAAQDGTPGAPSGQVVRGWKGRPMDVQFVEGAVPNAPLVAAEKPKPQGDAYVQRYTAAPSTLNYFASNEGVASRLARYQIESMLNINPDNPTEVWPWLAKEWEVSEDHLTYTYRLRKGILFADGRPFTSRDVAFSFAIVRDPEVSAQHLRGYFEQVQSLETPDDYTVVVRYRNKDWRGLYAVGYHLKILNSGWYEEFIPHYADKLGIEEYSTEPGTPGFGAVFNKIRVPSPGTGPYFVPGLDYDPDRAVELLQNQGWWGAQIKPTWNNFGKLRFVFISDDVAAFEEFRKGNFDTMVIDASAWDDEYSKDAQLLETTNYYSYDHLGLGYSHITWNTREPPFDDPRVRRAMAHLLDRQWIVDEVQRGRGEVGYCHGKPAYKICQTPGLKPLPFDIDKARQLLAEAGWKDTDGDGILDRDGKRFEFEVKVGSSRRFYSQVVGLLKDACAKVGIRASMRTLEWATFIEDYYERRFDAAVLYTSFQVPWISPREAYHSSADVPRGGNSPGWRNPRIDELTDAMIEEFDDQKRLDMYWEFNRIHQEEQPRTLLVHGLVNVLQSKRFEDVTVMPAGLRIMKYWVKPENVKYTQ